MKEAFSLSFLRLPRKTSRARLFGDRMEYLGDDEIARLEEPKTLIKLLWYLTKGITLKRA